MEPALAVLIAIVVVAILFWQQIGKIARRRDIAPPAERVAARDRPLADAPCAVAPDPADPVVDMQPPAVASPLPEPAPLPGPPAPAAYAFASRRPAGRTDRTASIMRRARGKGLCSPRRMPS